MLSTTDDPADSLEDPTCPSRGTKSFPVKVLPAFRPDRALNAERAGFREYIALLQEASGIEISHARDVIAALERRVDFFHQAGCRLSDHALDTVPFVEPDWSKADAALSAGLRGEPVDPEHLEHYRTAVLVALGGMYRARGWVQQYHVGAMRNVNSRMFARFGPDTGFDAIEDAPVAAKLAKLLDAQERNGALPKTILYTLNPRPTTRWRRSPVVCGRDAGKNPVRQRLVVLRPEGGHAGAVEGAGGRGAFGPVRRHADGFPFLHQLPAPRILPPHPVRLIGSWVENGEYPATMKRWNASSGASATKTPGNTSECKGGGRCA